MMMPSVAISSVAGKKRAEIVGNRPPGRDRRAEIAGKHLADIVEELHAERLVEAHLEPRRLVDAPACARSPTTASTGSIGTTRPMKKVMASRPEEGQRTATA